MKTSNSVAGLYTLEEFLNWENEDAANATKQEKVERTSKVPPAKNGRHKPFRRSRPMDYSTSKKGEFFSMRMSAEEMDALERKAKKCHMANSTYARETLLKSTPLSLTAEEQKKIDELYDMLDDAKFNIQQMSNYFHSSIGAKDNEGKTKYDKETWKELQTVIKKMKSVIYFFEKRYNVKA